MKLNYLSFLNIVCVNYAYGKNCSEKCSPYCTGAYNQCDRINGSCTFGCLDGYQGELCDKGRDFMTEVNLRF